MNTAALIDGLWQRTKAPAQSHEELVQLFEDYKAAVAHISGSGQTYRIALQHAHEEFPDLQRLIGKRHDAVLKGRLADAVRLLRKKVAEIAPEPAETAAAPGSPSAADRKPVRNTPNIGMD